MVAGYAYADEMARVAFSLPERILPDEVMTETVMGFLSYELEPGSFIDAPRRNEDAIGPEQHFFVAMAPREADAPLEP
jgi:hypothetical protein